jgi:hypothetical protein
MPETPDKPAGTESHPPDVNPERQGPNPDRPRNPKGDQPPKDKRPSPEASPGMPGIPGPKQGKV